MNEKVDKMAWFLHFLVFGIQPQSQILNTSLRKPRKYMKAIADEMIEMNNIVIERRIATATSSKFMCASYIFQCTKDIIFIGREKEKEWISLFPSKNHFLKAPFPTHLTEKINSKDLRTAGFGREKRN